MTVTLARRRVPVLAAVAVAAALLAPAAPAAAAGAASHRSAGLSSVAAVVQGHQPAVRSHTIRLVPRGPAADAIYPEGVAARGRTFYVGSTTDGTIYRGRVTDDTATPYLLGGQDGRTSAVGLALSGRRLYVAGGSTGLFFVYDVNTKALLARYAVPGGTEAGPTFLNDEAVAPDGSVYVTDSVRPVLYRVPPGARTDGTATLPVFLDFTGTPLDYQPGFNVNGIAISRDGRYAIVAQSNTATLYRIDLQTKQVTPIDLGGASVSGDGLVLVGTTLFAVERQGDTGFIVLVQLSDDFTSGRVTRRYTDPTFDDPTTAALAGGGRLIVVNSQFGARAAGVEPGPFTVSVLTRTR